MSLMLGLTNANTGIHYLKIILGLVQTLIDVVTHRMANMQSLSNDQDSLKREMMTDRMF